MSRPRLGVLSDTHGLLRPQALAALERVERIIHAGDVGKPEILDRLRAVAPLDVVRGNVDRDGRLATLPATECVEWRGHAIHVLHILEELALDPRAAAMSAVVYGHSHRPEIERRDGVLYLNPGSAGPRRFRLPVTLAELTLDEAGGLEARIVPLDV